MVRRPFINKRIDELEQMFKTSGTDVPTLKGLEDELIHRSTPRAVGLLRAVRRRLALPDVIGRSPEPGLFGPPLPSSNKTVPVQPEHTAPVRDLAPKLSPPVQPAPPRVELRRSILPPRPSPGVEPIPFPGRDNPRSKPDNAIMSSEEACKFLQVTLGAAWETIEQARREVVQKSHPNKIRSFAPERQSAIVEQARRANAAARILFSSRIHDRPKASPLAEEVESASDGASVSMPQAIRRGNVSL